MKNQHPINRAEYIQTARNMYRQETEKKHKDALIACFMEDFSNLSKEEQEAMKQDLLEQIKKCRTDFPSTKGKEKKQLQKDLSLFSVLARELKLENALQLSTCNQPDGNTTEQTISTPTTQTVPESIQKDHIHFNKSGNSEEYQQDDRESITFNDSDFGANFALYCREHGITRADGKTIPWKGGFDTEAIFLDKEGNSLALEYVFGSDGHNDLGTVTEYRFVKVRDNAPIPINTDEKKDETPNLEQGISHHSLEQGEQKAETSGNIPLLPEEEPTSAQLSPLGQYDFNLTAALSDTENIHLENARYTVEQALRDEYHQVSKWNIFKKANLFLQRGRLRKKRIAELMEKNTHLPFSDDEKLNTTLAHATNRHETEKELGLGAVEGTEIVDIPAVNELAQDYIEGKIEDSAFESRFNDLLQHDTHLSASVKDISHLGTNILQKLKLEKAQYQLVSELSEALETEASTDHIQDRIEQFLKEYQKTPDFLKDIQADLNEKNLEKLKRYFKHQKAIRAMALKNLKMKLSILTGGKSAYHTNNNDREKGWIHKLGKKLDTIPRYLQVPSYLGLGAVLGLAGGPLGLGVVGTSILTTSTFAGTTGFMNFVKKWTHHTKEQNTHEKDLTHTYDKQQKLIEQWKTTTQLRGAKNWFKRYRAKRQLELYDQTTQQNVVKTQEVSKTLLAFATSLRPLSETDRQGLLAFVMGAKARLQAYWETGHNFLASSSPEEVEHDMDQLHQALLLASEKLGITFSAIDQQIVKNQEGENVNYQDMVKELHTDYHTATKHFRQQRISLATKYGIGTAALSAGTALGFQALLGTGAFSSETSFQSSELARQSATSDHFGLGSHTLTEENQIKNAMVEQLKNLTDVGDKVTLHYGSGTDATALQSGSLLNNASAYHAKLQSVHNQIQHLHLTADQKSVFLDELSKRSWEADWAKTFTNDFLQGDRCAEGLLQMAKGLEASGNTTLVPELSYDAAKSIAGTTIHNSGERIFSAGMQITDVTVHEIAGSGSTWRVPITGFANTFKDNEKRKVQHKKGHTTKNTSDENCNQQDCEYTTPEHPGEHNDVTSTPSSKEIYGNLGDKEGEESAMTDSHSDEKIDNDLQDFETIKKTPEVQKFLDYKGLKKEVDQNGLTQYVEAQVFEPQSCIDYHGKKIYLTGVVNEHYIVAYIEQKGEIIPRVFRKSNSGGNWHAVPGYESDSRVSKGEFVPNISYEKGTVVKKDFNQILDAVGDKKLAVNSFRTVMKEVYGKDIPTSANYNGANEYNNMPKSAQEYYDETVVFDELLSPENPNCVWELAFRNFQDSNQIKAYYDQLSVSDKMDFSASNTIDTYLSYHKYLGEVENQVMTAKVKSSNPDFDGREIHITIATAKNDGLSWVENIVFADDEGTSFLTQKNPISGGILTTKPLEYYTQVPNFIGNDPTVKEYEHYEDIRPFMQNNPLIKEWKKIKK